MFKKVLLFVFVSAAFAAPQYGHGGHGSSYASYALGSHGGLGNDGGYGGNLNGGYHGGLVLAQAQGHGHQEHIVDYYAHPKYEFKYGVSDAHTGDQHSQSEVRDGDTVHGQYSLHEPDGTIRIVKYTADHKNGFNAQVIRQGHAAHPETTHRSNFVAFGHHGGLGGGNQQGGYSHGGY